MTRRARGSLQLRIAFRVAALYTAATLAVIGVLMSRAYDTAHALGDRELMLRASELARRVSLGADKVARLDLLQRPGAAFDAASIEIFAIRDGTGRVIAASPAQFADIAAAWPPAGEEPLRFSTRLADQPQSYSGLSAKLDSAAGPLSISVARSDQSAAVVYSLLRKFIHDILWAVSFLVIAALTIAILAVRGGLKPVRRISEMAAVIGPGSTSVRLPDKDLPSEIAPLVGAVNRAFDRLEEGFSVQRQFTANAAHELRTPLAIITAALDALEENEEVRKLKADVARMNRTVEQLLSVARLDSIALDVSVRVDLDEVGRELVAAMAPWALGRGRRIAFAASERPILVRGNEHAIADAIRNLVENAVAYAPPRTEILVSVHPDGRICVADRGPGIALADRRWIFDRFWRGKSDGSQGAGLGLAIVKEIMRMHGGTVAVDGNPRGGSVFTLSFPTTAGSNAVRDTRTELTPAARSSSA